MAPLTRARAAERLDAELCCERPHYASRIQRSNGAITHHRNSGAMAPLRRARATPVNNDEVGERYSSLPAHLSCCIGSVTFTAAHRTSLCKFAAEKIGMQARSTSSVIIIRRVAVAGKASAKCG